MLAKYSERSRSVTKIKDHSKEKVYADNDQYLKLRPEETIAERVKLKAWERKTQKTRLWIKTLTPNKLLTRLSVLSAQVKARNSSSKLKSEIRQIAYLLY